MKHSILFFAAGLTVLVSSCAKRTDLEATQKRLSDAREQLDQARRQQDSLQKLEENLQAELSRESAKTDAIEIAVRGLNKQNGAGVPHRSKIEDEIEGQLVQTIGKNENLFPRIDWVEKHDKEEGFNEVVNLIVVLAEIQDQATKGRLALTDEIDKENVTDLIVPMGVATLYDENPKSAVWVARFWKEKAEIFNLPFTKDVAERYSKEDAPMEQIKDDVRADMKREMSTYYYDHWKEIKEMVMDSLITERVKEDMKKAK